MISPFELLFKNPCQEKSILSEVAGFVGKGTSFDLYPEDGVRDAQIIGIAEESNHNQPVCSGRTSL